MSTSTPTPSDSAASSSYPSPSALSLQHAVKIAIVDDKPIMLDYWAPSLDQQVIIGVRENSEKLLVKSQDEYTSPIEKIFRVENEYLIITANSIYMVSSNIKSKRIS
jgi:hypothetical protein